MSSLRCNDQPTTAGADTPAVTHQASWPEVPGIPGLRLRAYRGTEDLPGINAVNAAASRAAGSKETHSLGDTEALYRNLTNCDLDRDLFVAAIGGTIVGYARCWWADRSEGGRGFAAVDFVDPAHALRGLEEALSDLAERRQLALARAMAGELAGRPAFLVRYARGTDSPAIARLETAGFTLARRWAEMIRPDFEAIPDIPVPDGFELRRGDTADPMLLRRVFDLGAEVFSDHYGESVPTEADFRAFAESPQTDPALFCLAFDLATGEMAGHILNYLGLPEPDGSVTGWTESIAVRAPYRRRGLASAMLAASLRIVRDAGATRAALGVDQSNPNEALTLYERLGFRVTLEDLEFHRKIAIGEVRS